MAGKYYYLKLKDDFFEREELTEAETAFYEEHKKLLERLETEDIT